MPVRLEVKLSFGALTFDKKETRAVFRAVGQEVAAAARALIRRTAGSGRRYGRHIASAPGQPPTSDTGALARSIKVKPYRTGLGVAIRAYGSGDAWYAAPLEVGARKYPGGFRRRHRAVGPGNTAPFRMQPRPFMEVALASRAASLGPRIATALEKGVKFVKQKP
jgi:hypothetical protein